MKAVKTKNRKIAPAVMKSAAMPAVWCRNTVYGQATASSKESVLPTANARGVQEEAIAEEYIEGREFYIGIFGHKRLTVLPPREMIFGNLPDDEPRIATYKAKWDKEYQKRWKIDNVPAKNLDEALLKKVSDMCKRAYRALNMKCYARFDIRITPEGKIYIIEPNANPSLAPDDEFVLAAKKYGLSYDQLLDRLMQLALSRG